MRRISVAARVCLVLVASATAAVPAHAQSFTMYVGYADGLRGSPNHPDPWFGSANVAHFYGFAGSGEDAGALMIQNSGTSVLTLNGLRVQIGSSYTYDFGTYLVGSPTLAPGQYAIFTGANGTGDFDTSDILTTSCGTPITAVPVITATVNGTVRNFNDTGLILTTGGVDLANCPGLPNEALGWRPVGTSGVNNPGNQITPEPSTLALLAGGLTLVGGFVRRRKTI